MTSEQREPEAKLFNHAELIYAPGERALAQRFFEALGCEVMETGGPYLVVKLDPKSENFYDNVLYVSEMVEEQRELEAILKRGLDAKSELGDRHKKFVACFERQPQRTTHLGFRLTSTEELDRVLGRLEVLGQELPGRVTVPRVIRPGDEDSLDPHLIQAFVRTDICASGLLCLGQHFELQVPLGR